MAASKNSARYQMKINVLVVGTLLGFSDASRGCKSVPTLSCSATRQSMLDLRTLLFSLDSKHCNGHTYTYIYEYKSFVLLLVLPLTVPVFRALGLSSSDHFCRLIHYMIWCEKKFASVF